MLNITIAIVGGYLLGSTPSAYIAGRLSRGIDLRDVGSKNMGTEIYGETDNWRKVIRRSSTKERF